jgi:4-aminobutyrate aminotransferase-like enzyme
MDQLKHELVILSDCPRRALPFAFAFSRTKSHIYFPYIYRQRKYQEGAKTYFPVITSVNMPSDASTQEFWAKASKYLMSTGVPSSPIIITRAKGTKLYDSDGNQILDFTSGQMSSLLGHSHPEIVEVVQEYVATLDHLLSNMVTKPVVELAERLGRLLPAPLEKSFFLNTGSESTEAAIKMAKLYTGKFEIVAFSASYHGLTSGSGAATYSAGRKNGGPVMPGSLVFPAPYAYRSRFRTADGSYDWETEMDFGWSMIDTQSVGSLAAFIMEPILSTGGILDPPKGYLKRMEQECRKRGMLIIMDEAQTGVGRTGKMFGFQHDDIIPDILALSKTLGCGLPLASVSTTADIERGCIEAKFLWLTTHLNDPLTAAVGNKVLEIVERDNMSHKAAERGEQLRTGLLKLQEKYWCIGDVRGRGLLQGIEIISDAKTKAPGADLGQAVSERAMARGLSCNVVNLPGMGGVFRLAPPVTVSAEEIDSAVAILDECFGYVLEKQGLMVNGTGTCKFNGVNGVKKVNGFKYSNGVKEISEVKETNGVKGAIP